MDKLTINNVEEIVYNHPTKYHKGFTPIELNDFLVKYEVNIDDFFTKMGIGHTCMIIDGYMLRYHCDILTTLRCLIENRDIKFEEWD